MKLASPAATNVLSLIAIAISVIALVVSVLQLQSDYSPSVALQPGALPLTEIALGPKQLEFEVQNTSKSNVDYYLRVRSNIGFIDGPGNKPQAFPTSYESQTVRLGKAEWAKSSYSHKLTLDAGTEEPQMPLLATLSGADYYLLVEVLDARNGRTLLSSICYYHFDKRTSSFILSQPVIDTTGESQKRQASCSA